MKRIIDKQTKLFLRDDFTFNSETEIGLEVEPAQGLYIPKWNGEAWEEGATQEYIDSLKAHSEPQEPTEIELLMLAVAELDMQKELYRTENQVAIAELAESLIGGI